MSTYTGSDGRQYTVPDEEHTSDPARRQYSYMHIQSFEDGSVMVTFSLHGWTTPERDSFGSLAEAIEEHPLILTIITDRDGNA